MATQETPETEQPPKRRHKRKAIAVAAGLTAGEALVLRSRSGSLIGMRTVVRCRRGHLFTTVWIPGASVKALRLGPWRVQRCPVGHHWSLVTPAKVSELSDEQRELAGSVRDTFVP